jgi:hypothetical protein
MLDPLATQDDATAFGMGTISAGAFARASARVRGYTGLNLTEDTYEITARGQIVQLPQRPVIAVTSVVDDDGNDVDWTLRAGGVLNTDCSENLTIEYDAGYTVLPDALVELVCTIASRLDTVDPAAAAGVQQETGGSESVTFGFDSYNAISELTTGEKRALDKLFPRRPGVVVMRP